MPPEEVGPPVAVQVTVCGIPWSCTSSEEILTTHEQWKAAMLKQGWE